MLVTSFYPLTVYVYNEGLTRFASEKYSDDCSSFVEHYSHLTNYSLNKLSENFIRYVLFFVFFITVLMAFGCRSE